MGEGLSPEGLGLEEKAGPLTDKTRGHRSGSAGALEATTYEEGTMSPMPQAGTSSSSMEGVLSLFLGSLQAPAGRWEERKWERPLTPPSHSSLKDASTLRGERPYHGLQIAQSHIRQVSAFSSCSLYAVTSLLTWPNLPTFAALPQPCSHVVLLFTCYHCKQDTSYPHRMSVTLISCLQMILSSWGARYSLSITVYLHKALSNTAYQLI